MPTALLPRLVSPLSSICASVFYDEGNPLSSSAAVNILTNVYIHIAIGAIIGYFLGELAIGTPSAIWLPIGLVVAAMLSGIHFAFRGIAISSGLGSRAIGGLFLVIGLTAVTLGILSFIIESADCCMGEEVWSAAYPMSYLENLHDFSDPHIARRVNLNSGLAIVVTLALIGLGMIFRAGILNATTAYEDEENGIRGQIPLNWLLDENQSDYVFRVENPNARPFKTLIQVQSPDRRAGCQSAQCRRFAGRTRPKSPTRLSCAGYSANQIG